MSTIDARKLQIQRYIYHENIKINHAMKNTRKNKVKLRYDLLWNKLVQTFAQTIQRLLNVPAVDWY